MDDLKPGELTDVQKADVLEKLIPEIEGGLNIHFYELAALHRAVDVLRRPAQENKGTELPRCDRCEHCTHAPSKKADGFTHYCDLSGRDVGQSHFGRNSPRVCPMRTPENKPLTLEQLRQMDGEPVWVCGMPGHKIKWAPGWRIIDGNRVAHRRWNDTSMYLYFADYGRTWLAYARKPEEATT